MNFRSFSIGTNVLTVLGYKAMKKCDKESIKECNNECVKKAARNAVKNCDINDNNANKNENNAKVMHKRMCSA